MKSQQWRGLDFFNPDKTHPNVLIIGCGHIGSYLAFGLARMGVKEITVVDHDMVEPHNLPNQFFAESLVKDLPNEPTLYKVIALQQTIQHLVPAALITAIPSRIETSGIKVGDYGCNMVAVDDMNVRKWIWNELMTRRDRTKLLIDARTGGAFANTFGIMVSREQSRKIYEENLYDNSDAAPLPCTGTAIIDVSFGVVADCIQKYRQFILTNAIISIHTFHDYVVGTTSIMRMQKIVNTELERTADTPGVQDGDVVAERVDNG